MKNLDTVLKPIAELADKNYSRRGLLTSSLYGIATITLFKALRPESAAAATAKIVALIADNHGHEFGFDLTTLFDQGPNVYTFKGSDHPHQVNVTQQVLDTLRANKKVDVTSSTDGGHTHVVRFVIR